MALVDSLLMELELEAQSTERLLERVPEEKLGWRPHAKSFTLGQLALHLAQIPAMLAAFAAEDSVEIPQFRQEQAAGRNQLLEAARDAVAKARETLASMDDRRMGAPWSVLKSGHAVMTLPRIAMLRSFLLNHYYHHRGQLTVYLRLLDVPLPSVYGPSADENPFA